MKKRTHGKIPMIPDEFAVDQENLLASIEGYLRKYRLLRSRVLKEVHEADDNAFDLEYPMDKRRIRALLSSLESMNEKQRKNAGDWIMLNIYSENYNTLQNTGHILTAASIWILDRLNEQGVSWDEVYPLLPTDREEISDFIWSDVFDTQYDRELIASVECVLADRNRDIEPLEGNGEGGFRLITSRLTAAGNGYASVPSRQKFDALLSLVSQSAKDEAVKQFETCFSEWTARFFEGASIVQDQYTIELRTLNSIQSEMNELGERIEHLLENMQTNESTSKKSKRQQSPTKSAYVNNKSVVPEMIVPPYPALSTEITSLSASPIPGAFSEKGEIGGKFRPITPLMAQIDVLNQNADDVSKKLESAINRRISYITTMSSHGYLSSEEEKELLKSEAEMKSADQISISDPYALCFALLYLVEIDSDLPWLYGASIGVMKTAVEHLPWGISGYEPIDITNLSDSSSSEIKNPVMPVWSERSYCKNDDEHKSKSLAHIVFELTSGLVPRDHHWYDLLLKELKKYGLCQDTEASLFYAMMILYSSRNKVAAKNFDDDYMRSLLGADDRQEESENETSEMSRAENDLLVSKIKELEAALYNTEKTVKDISKKYDELKAAYEAERRELADLREIIFNKENLDKDDRIGEDQFDDLKSPYFVKKKTVVFGGFEKWVKSLKPMVKGEIKFVAREAKIDASLVRNADVIWIQTNALPHRSFYSIANIARKLRKPIRYFTNASAVKCFKQMVENDMAQY